MQLQTPATLHLSYCLNIHPGERLEDLEAAIVGPATEVAQRFSDGQPFGLGLRVAGLAAQALEDPARIARLKQLMAERNLYAFTINGFPYGQFHGGHVKEEVYKPDWRTSLRVDYTRRLADLLAELLPEGVTGSISTVPGSYRSWLRMSSDAAAIANRLLDVVSHLHGLRLRTGRVVQLALEPEPACMLETSSEFVAFYLHHLLPIARVRGMGESAVRQHLGLCLDTCHAALAYEDPAQILHRLRQEGISVPKIQLSAALCTTQATAARETLRAFAEPVYLHQVGARTKDGQPVSWVDLPNALADDRWDHLAEARVHYHVPLFWGGAGVLRSTADALGPAFFDAVRSGVSPHIEVETYTFSVLPWGMRGGSVVDSVVRELQWARSRLVTSSKGAAHA